MQHIKKIMKPRQQRAPMYARWGGRRVMVAMSPSSAAVVLFNGDAITTQTMSSSRSSIEAEINLYGSAQYPCTSLTHISQGMLNAKTELDSVDSSTYLRVAVVLSDGEQNSQYGGSAASH